ncbi:UbiA-like polyprenyltransferase [Mahella sp.]|uniref:UbiA-like polyprenyltransferase n=1 Tax=Mahella sp. TaxID=2798721 RepID=UPI0025C25ADA|nr:UbiA-like polyprenyltransferase [Mahella sp.]
MNMVFNKLRQYAEMVMFSHTLFSLPFGLMAMLWAADGLPSFRVVFWILVALFGARNGANALNRLIDKDIDATNPRTVSRHLPRGQVKPYEAAAVAAVCFALMVWAAYELNPLCFMLSPVAILLFVLYSYTKRFTWACHIILGIACGGAPVGAWMAVTGSIGWPSLVLGAVVMLWVAGFDVIYATQDVDFDKDFGLFSIPVKFGIKNALLISTVFHIIALVLLLYLFFLLELDWLYLIGITLAAILIFIEHRIVSPDHLEEVKIASYSINQIVSVVLFIFTAADMFLLR